MAAKYYRKAEDLGVKIIGNTWCVISALLLWTIC